MKTVDVIDLLSKEAGPARHVSMARGLVPAGLLGGLIAAVLALTVLGLIPQSMFTEPGPWIKMVYASALVFAAAWLVSRLGKPGASGMQACLAVLGVVGVMAMSGVISYLATPEPDRAAALMGHSWLVCPWAILSLSLPVLAGSFWAMRGLAPTRLTRAGAACGVFSGAVAALAYALACTEPAAPFIAVWYTLGIALSGALGAFLGPKFLQW